MSWKIVEFGHLRNSGSSCGHGSMGSKPVSVVPQIWLHKRDGGTYCWWPRTANVTNFVRKSILPQPDWEEWYTTFVTEETFYEYAFAREILCNASDVTDIDERVRDLKKKDFGRGKRSPKKKCMREEGEINNTSRSVLSELPDISSDEDELQEMDEPDSGAQVHKSCSTLGQPKGRPKASATSSGLPTTALGRRIPEVASQQPRRDSTFVMTQPEVERLISLYERMSSNIEKLTANVSRLSTKVVALEETQRDILERLNEGFHSLKVPQKQQGVELPFNIPVGSWLHFQEVMDSLKDGDVKEELVRGLSRVGGKDLTAVVNAVLSKLLTNNFAEKCSWKGQRGDKYALEKSALLDVVHGAVLNHVGLESTTEDRVKEKIQNWLKQASRRLGTGGAPVLDTMTIDQCSPNFVF